MSPPPPPINFWAQHFNRFITCHRIVPQKLPYKTAPRCPPDFLAQNHLWCTHTTWSILVLNSPLKFDGQAYATYMHAYIHTYTYIHTHTYAYIHTYTHICIHTYIHTYIYAYIHNTYIIHTYNHIRLLATSADLCPYSISLSLHPARIASSFHQLSPSRTSTIYSCQTW